MSQIIQCQGCGSRFTAMDHQVGTWVECSTCGQRFVAGPPLPGEPPPSAMGYAVQTPGSGKAIASMVLGIASIPLCSGYGILSLPCAILALVFGRASRRAIAAGEMPPGAAGYATAGIVCGTIGLVLSGVAMLGILAWFAFAASMAGAAWALP